MAMKQLIDQKNRHMTSFHMFFFLIENGPIHMYICVTAAVLLVFLSLLFNQIERQLFLTDIFFVHHHRKYVKREKKNQAKKTLLRIFYHHFSISNYCLIKLTAIIFGFTNNSLETMTQSYQSNTNGIHTNRFQFNYRI